jgi:hypothetical protein
MPFPDLAWCVTAIEVFNADPEAPGATAGWTGDFGVVVERPEGSVGYYIGIPREGSLPPPVPMAPEALTARGPAYHARATEADWRALVQGELDPIAALVQRRLVAQGDLQQVIARLHYKGLAERWLQKLRKAV